MATNLSTPREAGGVPGSTAEIPSVIELSLKTLSLFASLKLTVALFAMAIFIILAGTLAQVQKDIWDVIREYFRTPVAWIEFQLFFPPSFFPNAPRIPGGFPFPGGWLIGVLMAVNLFAAHAIRFTFQAKGTRLLAGMVTIVLGALFTAMIIATADNVEGLQQASWISYPVLWWMFKGAVGGLFALSLVGLWAIPRSSRLKWRIVLGLSILLGGALGWLMVPANGGTPSDSSMRILWQLTQGTFAGGFLLVGCLLAFRKRAGVVLLHAGIGLMMLSEVLVGTSAVEAQISLNEGQSANYVQDIRDIEFAFVEDASDPKMTNVVAVPRSRLLGPAAGSWFTSIFRNTAPEVPLEKPLDVRELPFTVRVVRYFPNASIVRAGSNDRNLATEGVGKEWIAEAKSTATGTDTSGQVDLPAAYVELIGRDGTSLGTRLVGVTLSEAGETEKIQVGDRTFEASLRFKRTYKPYTLTLIDVTRKNYIGTSTPRDYSSTIHLFDASRATDRDVRIWMNNPLRFAGETFYQTGHAQDPRTGQETSTISVVTNRGWMIPYVSCMIVAVGMFTQFLLTLQRFLNRPRRVVAATGGGRFGWVVPILVLVTCVGYVASRSRPPSYKTGEFNLYKFGGLPVVSQGRVKPIDSLARTTLLTISGRSTYVDADEFKKAEEKAARGEKSIFDREKKLPATRWLLDMIAKPQAGLSHPVMRIDNLDLLSSIDLKERPGFFRYGLSEFADKLNELGKQADLARDKPAAEMSPVERKVLQLEKKIGQVLQLLESFQLPNIRPESAMNDLMTAVQRQKALESRNPPLVIPVPEADSETEAKWQTYTSAWIRDLLGRARQTEKPDPFVAGFDRIIQTYEVNSPAEFNRAVSDYEKLLRTSDVRGLDLKKVAFENYFNHVDWLTQSMVLYVIAFVIAATSWLVWPTTLSRTAFLLLLFTFALHTVALASRIYISGRPPVTNLYSSAVFIGWACVLLGVIYEGIYGRSMGNVVAAVAGYLTLYIAAFLGADGDTFEVLQAVLDTQFWLATHVTCITLGYATTYVAGLIGVLYLLRGVLTRSLTSEDGKELARAIYGTVCFSMFFSFVGTVLGGLWADDSWGRFWGWDPKENGALIIVLWNALILHARWGNMVKDRGMAVLAVAGNICVSWSWFGVNELGIGLHSYGFREGTLLWLGLFVLSQLALVGLGLLPKRLWLSPLWSTPER